MVTCFPEACLPVHGPHLGGWCVQNDRLTQLVTAGHISPTQPSDYIWVIGTELGALLIEEPSHFPRVHYTQAAEPVGVGPGHVSGRSF